MIDSPRDVPAQAQLPRKPHHVILFLTMMAGFVWLSIESSLTSPVLLDEYAHVPAGLSHWELGRYFLYREKLRSFDP